MLTTNRFPLGFLFPTLSIAALSLAALSAACSDDASIDQPVGDAGADSRVVDASPDGAEPDADGGADGGIAATKLAAGQIILHGVTSDDHVIYTRVTSEGRVLEAARLGDGHVTTLDAALPEAASVTVKGLVIAIWTGVDAATVLGNLSFGTAEGTFRRNVATQSLRDMFWASEDGRRVAYYSGTALDQGHPTTADLVVADTDDDDATTTLGGSERVALDQDACAARVGFGADTLIAAYCSAGTTSARLVAIANAATDARRILVDGGLEAFWSADAQGKKIFVIAQAQNEGRIVTNDGTLPAASVTMETDVNEGFVVRDGSVVVYRKGTTLRRASTDGAIDPFTVATGEARRILDVSLDQSTILYHALPGRTVPGGDPDGERYVDLRTIPINATQGTPRTLVDTERALVLGLSPTGAHAFYISTGPKLTAVATDGSGERAMSLDFTGMSTTPWGSSAVLWKRTEEVGTMSVGEIVLANFAASGGGGSPLLTPLASSIPFGAFQFGSATSRRIVYVQAAGDAPGLYAIAVP